MVHHTEERKPTNTGRLALAALSHSQLVVRGREGEPQDELIDQPGARTLLLFPHEGAIPLEEVLLDDRPVNLVVPDGNWRQASKVRQRVAGLAEATTVSLPAAEPSIYRLRAEAHPHGLATLEAIARALRILEGDRGPAVEAALLAVFRVMVERTLWSRGELPAERVTGGIPAEAFQALRGS